MHVRAASAGLALALLLVPSAPAQSAEPVDQAAVDFLRQNGLEKSQVMEHLSWICDVHGPRLTGSTNLRRAQRWAVATFQEWGLQNPRTERWGPFGRGWRLDRCVVEVVGDNPWPVLAYPKAWSPSLDGRVEAEVVLASDVDADALRAMDLGGKIVFLEAPRDVGEPFDAEGKRFTDSELLAMADQRGGSGRARDRNATPTPAAAVVDPRSDPRAGFQRRGAVLRVLAEKNPLAIVDRASKGTYGTVFVQGANVAAAGDGGRGNPRAADAKVIPQFTFAVEHYNRIVRLVRKKLPVRLALELKTTFLDEDPYEYNVVAEIPGTDPELGQQLVMLGAHFDSWQSGTGATDNGCGSAVVMEAARLIQEMVKATGKGPRRTIRVALWSGEEQGLLGSRAYVAEHFGTRGGETKPAHAQLSGYFNLDNGTGRVRGVYLQGNEAVAPIFRAWLRPFHDLGASTLTLNDTGGTDHLAFDGVGLPGFQFIQDPVSYDTRTHHSNMDVWDHAVAEDLRQAATVMASFVWHTAQRDQMLPRKPRPAPSPERERR
ncbi:MAG: M28 family peptidase [Planctomycetes bacterium]|nr:M28 family peptidase [Planctomycetota bacterium]